VVEWYTQGLVVARESRGLWKATGLLDTVRMLFDIAFTSMRFGQEFFGKLRSRLFP